MRLKNQKKLKLVPSPLGTCGQENQTTEHILQRCPNHDSLRWTIWPTESSLQTKTKLYGCKEELEEDSPIHLADRTDGVNCEREKKKTITWDLFIYVFIY